MQILAGVLLFFLSLTIGSLLGWHIYLLCHNMTTIEVSYYLEFHVHPPHSFLASHLIVSGSLHQYREAVRARWLAKKSGQKYRHRFDLGILKNIQMVLLHKEDHPKLLHMTQLKNFSWFQVLCWGLDQLHTSILFLVDVPFDSIFGPSDL